MLIKTQETCNSYQTLHAKSNEWNVNVEINLESFSLIGESGCKNQPPPRYYTVMYLQPLLIREAPAVADKFVSALALTLMPAYHFTGRTTGGRCHQLAMRWTVQVCL